MKLIQVKGVWFAPEAVASIYPMYEPPHVRVLVNSVVIFIDFDPNTDGSPQELADKIADAVAFADIEFKEGPDGTQ